jgi:hypothetical protein
MANVKLFFGGTEESGTDEHTIVCFWNSNNEIFIEINIEGLNPSFICLDKSTAIKFAKTLRTEINKMEDDTNE